MDKDFDIVDQIIVKPKITNRKKRTRAKRFTIDEQRFIELYTKADGVTPTEIAKELWPDINNHYAKAKKLLNREDICAEIERIDDINRYRASYANDDITEALWKEATLEGRGSNQIARIKALELLGKHIGMFKEKKEIKEKDGGTVFNIVNYSTPQSPLLTEKQEKLLESVKDPELLGELSQTTKALEVLDGDMIEISTDTSIPGVTIKNEF